VTKLADTTIKELDQEMGSRVRGYIDTLTKPLGSLGRLEEIAIELAKMTSSPFPIVTPPGVIVMAADHGITAEGISAYPQEVTAQMVYNFLNGGAAINVFSRQNDALFEIVDMGVAQDLEVEGCINHKVRYGTANFLYEEAMTMEEALLCIERGREVANKLIQAGAKCLILGEMGIGNTTSSSAILSILSGVEVSQVVGAGTGISSEQIVHKQLVIEQAIKKHNPDPSDPIDILSKIGGLEIAGMVGAMLEAATQRVPILVDGFICTIAALLASAINKNAREYMIAGHQSQERGHIIALELLQKKPLIDLGLRLGEGSGAALSFPIVEAATRMLSEMATFSSAGVSDKE
jgi:nicotinate-nucleotide--dimethylbenzimidazole phosphoribosyltransferase